MSVLIEKDDKKVIDKLHDDELLYIFSFLDVYDLLNMGNVCQRFLTLSNISFKRFTKMSFMLRKTNVVKFIKVLDKLVTIMDSIHFSGGTCINKELNLQIINSILKLENLNGLSLIYFQLNKNILNNFSCLFMRLNTLKLNRCEIDDDTMELLINIPNLQILDLSGNEITGVHLPKLISKIKKIDIECCSKLDYNHFEEFLKIKKELESLNISFNSTFKDREELLETIAKTQPNLQKLYIGEIEIRDYSAISLFTNLKVLVCHQLKTYLYKIYIDNLLCLLNESAPNLEELDISFCIITIKGQNALEKLSKLTVLKIKRVQAPNFKFLQKLKCLKTIQHLDVSYCDLYDDVCIFILSHALNLKFLNIQCCKNLTQLTLHQIKPILNEQPFRKKLLKIDIRGSQQFLIDDLTINLISHHHLKLITQNS